MITLTIKRSQGVRGREGVGWILYGNTPGTTRRFHGRTTEWCEKWFPDADRAKAYANKHGWIVKGE